MAILTFKNNADVSMVIPKKIECYVSIKEFYFSIYEYHYMYMYNVVNKKVRLLD